MKYLIALVMLLAAPVAAKACDPLGVCSSAVVQSFGVQGHAVQVQTFAPVVQSFAVPQAVVVQNAHCGVAVQAFAVPQQVVVQQRVRVQNVRQPRVRVRSFSRTVIR